MSVEQSILRKRILEILEENEPLADTVIALKLASENALDFSNVTALTPQDSSFQKEWKFFEDTLIRLMKEGIVGYVPKQSYSLIFLTVRTSLPEVK